MRAIWEKALRLKPTARKRTGRSIELFDPEDAPLGSPSHPCPVPTRNDSLFLLIGPLGGVLVGLLLGWVVFGRAEPTPQPSVEPSAALMNTPSAAELASPEAAAVRASEPPVERRVERAAREPGPAGEERFVASSGPASDHSIVAAAVTQAGVPLEGVRFTLMPKLGSSNEQVQEAITGPEGSITFQVPRIGSYQLSAAHPQFMLEGPPGSRGRVAPGVKAVFRATDLVPLRAEVLGPDGRPPTEAFLHVQSGKLPLQRWTPENPVIGLPSGHHEIRALIQPRTWAWEAVNLATAKSEFQTVYAGRETQEPVRLVCEPITFLVGQIVMPAGTKSAQPMRVFLRASEPGEPVDERLLRGSDGTITQLEGRFEFSDLAPGSYWIGYAEYPWNLFVHSEAFEVTQGENVHNLVLPTPGEEAWLRARVADSAQRPVRDVRFTLSKKSPEDNWEVDLSQKVQADGSYRLVLTSKVDEDFSLASPEAEFTVDLAHSLFGKVEIPLEAGQREFEHVFNEPASLSIEVSSLPAGMELSTLDVRVSSGFYGGTEANVEFDPETQTFEVKRTEQGPCDVTISVVDSYRWPLARRRLSIAAGHNHVTVQLPTFFEIEVEAPGAPAKSYLSLRSGSVVGGTESGFVMAKAHTQIDDSGLATFSLLPAGSYQLTGTDEGQGMNLTVPGGPYRFEPKPADSWVVTLQDQSGLLAKSGFKSGDLIRSIGGQPFSATARANPWVLLRSDQKEPVQFEVQRGAATILISIDPSPTLNWNEIGGQFDLWTSGL